MKNFLDPFLYNLPHLDLHGYDRTGARAMTKMFIDENIKIDNKRIVIVHGKGSGAVKNAVYEELKFNKYVLSYKSNNYNDGETIVELK